MRLLQDLIIHTAITDFLSESGVLEENITHVLANIANDASKNQEFNLMNASSIISFLAGVNALIDGLPQSSNKVQVDKTLDALAKAGIGRDGHITHEVAKVAELGARHPEYRDKFNNLVGQYIDGVESGKSDNGALAQTVRQLQQQIDQVMRNVGQKPIGSMAKGSPTQIVR